MTAKDLRSVMEIRLCSEKSETLELEAPLKVCGGGIRMSRQEYYLTQQVVNMKLFILRTGTDLEAEVDSKKDLTKM